MDSAAGQLHEQAARHRHHRNQLYEDIDAAVAEAHAELEQERVNSDIHNPAMFADHARPDTNTTTDS